MGIEPTALCLGSSDSHTNVLVGHHTHALTAPLYDAARPVRLDSRRGELRLISQGIGGQAGLIQVALATARSSPSSENSAVPEYSLRPSRPSDQAITT